MKVTGEQAVELILSGHGVKFEKQYRFNSARQFKADFAIPEYHILIEYEGGTWTNGGHVRGKIYSSNCEKYNSAACLGWTVLRYTSDMIRDNPGQILTDVLLIIEGGKK